jgi:phage-related protein
MNDKIRNVYLYKSYFTDFLSKQSNKVKDKIIWTLKLIESQRSIPEEYFKHLTDTDGLYEIRVKQSNNIYRIFCFFDKGNLIIVTSGFQKKTQKTPKSEIERALKIKKEYETEK